MAIPILVTGGAGYIGSVTCQRLAAAGYLPISYDSMLYGHDWAVRYGPLVRADIRDKAALLTAFKQYKPVAVVHFAALTYVGESVKDPGSFYDANGMGTLTLLAAMREAGVKRMVFSSSCAVYGEPEEVPIPDGHRVAPISPYGWTKLLAEAMLADFARAHGFSSVSLRYFNAAGAVDATSSEDGLGEAHEPETHLIPLVIRAALGTRPELKVFGADYDTPDGTAVRDYVHVLDLAEAHVAALSRLLDGENGEAISVNLGTGTGVSVMEIIRAVEKTTGRQVPYTLAARRPGDPPMLVARAEDASRILDWSPAWTEIEKTIASAVRWHEVHG